MMAADRKGHGPIRVVGRATLLMAALAAVGVFHVWSHTCVTTAGYRLGELQRAAEELRAERNRLEVEVATLRAPGRLEAYARALGMAPPAPGAVVAGWSGEAAAGRAGKAGGEESLRPAPAEPAVQGRTGDTGSRRVAATTRRPGPATGLAPGEERVASRGPATRVPE
jgi:cell division protein FtsL